MFDIETDTNENELNRGINSNDNLIKIKSTYDRIHPSGELDTFRSVSMNLSNPSIHQRRTNNFFFIP